MAHTQRFSIRFDPWYRALSWATAVPPTSAYVEVDEETVLVRMGWAFHAQFPRAAIASTGRLESSPMGWGVHGFAGRWLVNGSRRGIVLFELAPRQRARVLGLPVALQQLMISLDDPDGLGAALQPSARRAR